MSHSNPSRESSVRSYSRAFPAQFDVARGAEIWDADGRRYLDFLAGCGSLNYGHNDPVLKEALIGYIGRDGLTHGLDMQTRARDAFIDALHEVAMQPVGLEDHVVQFTGPTGANAVEAALKLARKVTGRSGLVCFTNGFHGVSLGALAVTGNGFHRAAAGLPLPATTRLPYDGYDGNAFAQLDLFDTMLDDPSSGIDRPAAAIVETVQGEGGLRAASRAWLLKLQDICRRHDILLIVDDIQAGCGRTSSFFSFEGMGLDPDLVVLAKSLSGYGLPMAALLIRRSIDTWKPAEHNGTFRGNNHAFVTGTAALRHYWCDSSFPTEIATRAEVLERWLATMQTRYPTAFVERRGRGMFRGLVCADPQEAAIIATEAFRNGLILERSGAHDEVLKFLMPLNIPMPLLHEGLELLASSIADVLGAAHDTRVMLSPASKDAAVSA